MIEEYVPILGRWLYCLGAIFLVSRSDRIVRRAIGGTKEWRSACFSDIFLPVLTNVAVTLGAIFGIIFALDLDEMGKVTDRPFVDVIALVGFGTAIFSIPAALAGTTVAITAWLAGREHARSRSGIALISLFTLVGFCCFCI